jgi:Type I phosphodiesterase / nucleotide pyrophosphatase
MSGDGISPVERVREDLRRLGYLDTGLDRFVLGGAASVSPLRAGAGVALRVGLLGGALTGLAFTAAAALLDPERLRRPADLVVLMGYVAIAGGVVLGLLSWLLALLAAWVGRRVNHRPGPTFSRNVGLALAVVGTAYLALWWHSHARSAATGVQLVLMAVGLTLVLGLTRFGSLAAVAVLSAGGVGLRLPEARRGRRHVARLVAVSVAVFAAALLAASHLGREEATEVAYAVRPTGLRVHVVGIDGFDAGLALQMAQRGEMPLLARRLASGARARLAPEPERVPVIVWTTIATGRGPEAHGIRAAGARRLAGMTTPVLGLPESRLLSALAATGDLLRLTRTEPPSAVLRTVKAFWNVASEKGLRVGVVNWWATWPAEPVNGYVVSDRTFFRLERGQPFDREVAPAELEASLASMLPATGDLPHRLDLLYATAAARLRMEQAPDLDAVYLPGLDIFTAQEMGEPPSDLAALDARLSAVRAYYQFLDARIDELLAIAGPGEVALLIADPGRLDRRSTSGLVLAVGGPVQAGELGTVSERDLAPTILHLVGLPVSEEMQGRVWAEALTPAFRQAHPVRTVARYGRRRPAPTASGFDREMLQELRSLGYVQ